jgi:hypothetical protein
MTLYLLKVHFQMFLSIPITHKFQIFNLTLLSQMSDISTKTQRKHCCVSVERRSIFINLLTADIYNPTVHAEGNVAFQRQQWLRKIATRLFYTYSEYH